MHAIAEEKKALKFQELVFRLQKFWADRGCVLQPVSYTHLDVYKRQGEDCVREESSAPSDWRCQEYYLVHHLLGGRTVDWRVAENGMSFGEPGQEFLDEPVPKQVLEPTDVEGEDLGQDGGQPEDGVFAEEGCGGAPESSHLRGL